MPVRGIQAVEAGGDERVQRFGHREVGKLAGGAIGTLELLEALIVEEHSHGLDGVEGDALGASEDRGNGGLGQARNEAREQLAHGRQVKAAPGRATRSSGVPLPSPRVDREAPAGPA